MSYTSTNGMFTYTITNNTNYVIEQLDYDIILSSVNRWESLVTIDTRFPSSQTITISFIIDTLGTNILGGASITNSAYIDSYIYGNVIPSTADITMNNTYLYGLKTTIRNDGFSSYYHVLLHEIGHILGIGSFWYLTGCPKTGYDDNGTTKHYYTGTNAFREYNSCFAGFSNDAFLGIPIEDDGGAGTSGVHPEEGGVSSNDRYINGILHPGLGTELMTGWLDGSPVSTPLSKISLGFLEDIGYTVNYNLADVYTMSWLATTDANNLEQTYIKGFLDVSGGNMINRNGNLSVLDGTMDVSGDVTFDSKLSVDGDVSFNGTTIDICGNLYAQYPDNSIPAAAINGQVEATPNFNGDVAFQSNVTVALKAAIGDTTLPTGSTALKVTGDLDFTGSLLNNGAAFVSGATDLNGLSDAKVGGAEFTNSLLIGNTTTGSLSAAERNVGIGVQSLLNLTSGTDNTAIGNAASNANTTGSYNVTIGGSSNFDNQTGSKNTMLGFQAGRFNITDSGVAVGYRSLYLNSTGTGNTAIGFQNLFNTSGNENTSVGYETLYTNSTGKQNTASGYQALYNNTTGDYNTASGYHTLYMNETGNRNVAYGRMALYGNKTGTHNVSYGMSALSANIDGIKNTGIGYTSLNANTSGDYNTAVGHESGFVNTTGDYNTYIGAKASPDTGLDGLDKSTAIGYNAKVTASNQIMLGTVTEEVVCPNDLDVKGTLKLDGTAMSLDGLSDVIAGGAEFTNSLLIGHNNTGTLSAATSNVGVGSGVFNALTSGDGSTAVGYMSLFKNTSGEHNMATGYKSLTENTTGYQNIATGSFSLQNNDDGNENTATGAYSLTNNVSGSFNTATGLASLQNTTANSNTAFGYQAGTVNTTGNNNTYIGKGANAGSGETGLSSSTAIGFNAKVTASNQIMLGTATEEVVCPNDLDVKGTLKLNNTAVIMSLDGLSDVKAEGANFTGSLLIGHSTTGSLSSADSNVGIGTNVFNVLTTGSHNVAVGWNSLTSNKSGAYNVAIGSKALYTNDSATHNVATGYQALYTNSTGNHNVATGNHALRLNSTGSDNVATGYKTLENNDTGYSNVAIGHQALNANQTGYNNVATGYQALYNNGFGFNNVATGEEALSNNTTGDNNTAIGHKSGTVNTTGNNNTYIGKGADAAVGQTFFNNSTAIGYNATVTADNQIVLGTASEEVVCPNDLDVKGTLKLDGTALSLDGLSDVKFGGAEFTNSLLLGTTTTGTLSAAENNIGIGKDVLKVLTSGDSNIGFGYHALTSLNTGSNNVGIGTSALRAVTSGTNNIAIGNTTGNTVSGGASNILLGYQTGHDIVHGNFNTAIGYQALRLNTHASGNVSIGYKSLLNTIGLDDISTGDNTAIGYESGKLNTTGINNTYIGSLADADTGLTGLNNSTAIGYDAKVTKSNQMMLGTAAEKVNIAGDVTINPIDVSVDVSGIQQADQSLKFTIPYSMTALKYFCTANPGMIGDFTLADSTTETDKTYYVRIATGAPDDPFYIFSDTPNGTALNDTAAAGSGVQLTLYKGNTYTFIKTNTNGHPFMVGDAHNVTTGMKLESTGDGVVTASTYRDPYPLHVNGTANIERNLNVARTLTVSGPIRQW